MLPHDPEFEVWCEAVDRGHRPGGLTVPELHMAVILGLVSDGRFHREDHLKTARPVFAFLFGAGEPGKQLTR